MKAIKESLRKGQLIILESTSYPGTTEEVVAPRLDEAVLAEQDCVVILTDHSRLDYRWIVDCATLVVDTRNATKHANGHRHNIVKL